MSNNTISLPFPLARNNGEGVTAVSEIDVNAGGEDPVDGQTAIVGSYLTTTPEVDSADDSLIPVNGMNYSLGTIIELGISLSTQAMTLGCTLRFTAGDDFTITLPRPYTYLDENDQTQTDNPEVPARILGEESLNCTNGSEYLLHISTIGSGVAADPYINVFSLTELFTPSTDTDGVEEIINP